MKKVTALRAGKGRRQRVNVFLDGRFALSLDAGVVVKGGLRVGQELDEGRLEALAGADDGQRCFEAAARYLGYRPQSEAELAEKLHRRGFGEDVVAAVLARLKGLGLVDDTAFARFWRDSREATRPCSQWLMQRELQQKGVGADIIARVTGKVDDSDSAYRAARGRASRLPRGDYADFRHRLGDYLRRRGFGYGVIKSTVDRLWQEVSGANGEP